DAEEIVHTRSAAAKTIGPLEMKGGWRQDDDEGQHVEVLLDRRLTLVDRNQAALESETVGQHKRPRGKQGVGDDVGGDAQPFISFSHRVPTAASFVFAIRFCICSKWSMRKTRPAFARSREASKIVAVPCVRAVAHASGVVSETRIPVCPSTTFSRPPP